LINYGTKVDIYSLNKKDLSSFFLLNLIGLLLCSQFEQNENSKKWKKLVLLYHIDIYICYILYYQIWRVFVTGFGAISLPDLAKWIFRFLPR
jgi:chromate transport protein ChrA